MREFQYRQAQIGARVRYVNLLLLGIFLSTIEMPLSKPVLAALSVVMLVANLIYHVHISTTRRTVVATYLMSGLEFACMCVGIMHTGFVSSPFLILVPLNFFTVYFANFDKRMALVFAGVEIAVFVLLFFVWNHLELPVAGWTPHEYRGFAILMLFMQMASLSAYVYLSIQTNPFVQEIARQERLLVGQSNRAEIGTAMAMITHEIRTPLSTAYATVDLAIGALGKAGATADLPEARRRLVVAVGEMNRLNEMLDSVLSFCREKRGQLNPAEYRLRELIERALGFIALKYGRHAVNFTAEYRMDRTQRVRCDRDAMHQVLVNLLDNAMQHKSPDRPMRFEFSAFAHPSALAVTVRDNGKGIPQDLIPKVFEKYMTARDGGTGLGLAIVRQLIKDHRGRIEVQSTEGVGTMFTIVLPLSESLAIDGSPVRGAVPAPSR